MATPLRAVVVEIAPAYTPNVGPRAPQGRVTSWRNERRLLPRCGTAARSRPQNPSSPGGTAVVIVIREVHAHPRNHLPVFGNRHPRLQRPVAERAVAVVVEQ